jgi:hypothetical protein
MIDVCSSCVCWYDIEFDEILGTLDEDEKKAVQKQCGQWATFVIMDRMGWQAAKQNIMNKVKLVAAATDLDVLWQQLHPSQSTGLSHSIHSTSWIYRST